MPISPPSGLYALATTQTSVTLTWNAPPSDAAIAGYMVYRNGGQVGTVEAARVDSPTYADTGLAVNTVYHYTVAATTAGGESSHECSTISVVTDAPAGVTPWSKPG